MQLGPSDEDRFGDAIPDDRRSVYRAFNTLGWSDYVDPTYGSELPDVFYAGAGRRRPRPGQGTRRMPGHATGLRRRLRQRAPHRLLAELRDAVQAVRPGRN
ncbi:MAG: hypothetical protein R2705_22355 [Ilumatobacteraceae bacterium]